MDIQIKPLTTETLDDYLFFFDDIEFEENPEWSACYCFSFHFTGTKEQWKRESNRVSVIQYVNEGKMTGYLAYSEGKPVGWCNVNNRRNYQSLLKYYDLDINPDEKVCSVVCFLIHPAFRRQGIAQKLLEKICADYSVSDFDFIEAYPAKGKLSCERHYRGPLELYRRFDFQIIGENNDYYILRKYLK